MGAPVELGYKERQRRAKAAEKRGHIRWGGFQGWRAGLLSLLTVRLNLHVMPRSQGVGLELLGLGVSYHRLSTTRTTQQTLRLGVPLFIWSWNWSVFREQPCGSFAVGRGWCMLSYRHSGEHEFPQDLSRRGES